jgi:hypothetical protein
MKAAVCIAITLWVLLYAGAAAAAQRYATPGGSGPSPCVKAHRAR